MNGLRRVLILGTGPTSIQQALLLKKHINGAIGIAGRESYRSESFFDSIQQNAQQVKVHIQNDKHQAVQGTCSIDSVYKGYETVTGEWDTLLLSVTADSYTDVLHQVTDQVLKQVKCIILTSPTFGSNALVKHYVRQRHSNAEVISLSTYLGDTRWISDRPANQVITTAVKQKLYIGSTDQFSENMNLLCEVYKNAGVDLIPAKSPIEAETRNISLYVHPPLFMNNFSLSAILGETDTQTYVYKMDPEGPITQYLIRDMIAQWKEIMSIVEKLKIKNINLLKFMIDDNYPVRMASLARQDIEEFPKLESIHQEYLMYIRYTSLLIDPFSKPDQNGRYFDFSAVPFKEVFVNREGELDLPRMPKEDYYRVKIIQGIARHLNVKCPTIDQFISTYERKIEEFAAAHKEDKLSDAFKVQKFENDLQMVCKELKKA